MNNTETRFIEWILYYLTIKQKEEIRKIYADLLKSNPEKIRHEISSNLNTWIMIFLKTGQIGTIEIDNHLITEKIFDGLVDWYSK